MKSQYIMEKGCLVVYVPRELDHHQANRIRTETDLLIDTYHVRHLVFDFTETEFMDSSGIGMLIGRYKMMRFLGGTVTAIRVSERMQRILTMSGIYRVIDIYEGMPQQSNLL